MKKFDLSDKDSGSKKKALFTIRALLNRIDEHFTKNSLFIMFGLSGPPIEDRDELEKFVDEDLGEK